MRIPDWATEDGRVKLYLGDCLEILPTLRGIDAVVTDPPYGMAHPCNFASRGRSNLAECRDFPDVIGDDAPFEPSHLLGLGVPLVLWGGNYFANRLTNSGGWLVWDKERPDGLDQSTCEMAWTNCVKGVRRFRHLWNGMMRASEHGEGYHPTQKPAALFEWSLRLPWLQFETICDPYFGSCPCGVACVRLGRQFIGIEREPRYFEIAVKRIKSELERAPLFEAKPTYVTRDLFTKGDTQ